MRREPVCLGPKKREHRPVEMYETDRESPTGSGTVWRCSTCRREVVVPR